ncbi:MAG: hypothetical protein ACR2RB_05565 [Gammaproteobacteria bacterium]
MSNWGFALIATYPLAAHLAIRAGYPALPPLLLIVLIGGFALASARGPQLRFTLRLIAAILAAVGAAVLSFGVGVIPYLPPILISGLLAIVVGRTLLAGETPLLTRLATMARGELTPRTVRYTRGLTVFWAAFFVFLVIELTALALLVSLETWSVFAHLLNCLLAGLLIVGEYLFRRWYLSELEHPGFRQFLSFLRRNNFRAFSG